MGRLRLLFASLAVLGLVGCDHATKDIAARRLAHSRPVVLVADLLELRYAENRDTAFSLTRGLELPAKSKALALLAFLGCAVAGGVWWRRRGEASPLEHAGFALVVAGGLGNALDRLLRGYVVDFIHVTHWPIFNVADVLVALGAAAFLLGLRERPTTPPRAA